MKKVLVANRGEVAVRVLRSLQEVGIRSVAIFSLSDSNSMHRSFADEAYLLSDKIDGAPAYLDIPRIIAIAKQTNADTIHPGYGFLSENPEFAKACEDAGLNFIGPSSITIALLGDKVEAKKLASSLGLPVLPFHICGESPSRDDISLIESSIGFPLLLKAVMGGGGRGIRLIQTVKELQDGINRCSSEAKKFFNDGRVFVEKWIERARHVEIQILGDGKNIIHLYDRDCTVQRRQQKVIEIGPSTTLNSELYQSAIKLAQSVFYKSAGTVEFIVDMNTGSHYFMEMNPRLQVEHGVTEMITGVDIVRSQILIAQGFNLRDCGLVDARGESLVQVRGCSIQCRLLAEDPESGFSPTTGVIERFHPPTGPGLRVDSSIRGGDSITSNYDPLIAKVLCWDQDFTSCINRCIAALNEMEISGIKTNKKFLTQVLSSSAFKRQEMNTRSLESDLNSILNQKIGLKLPSQQQSIPYFTLYSGSAYGLGTTSGQTHKLEIKSITQTEGESSVGVEFDGNYSTYSIVKSDIRSSATGGQQKLREKVVKGNPHHIGAPYDGSVVQILAPVGSIVQKGEGLVVVTAMKMETVLNSPFTAVVERISVSSGDIISQGDLLLELKPASKL
eukprot:TRINITY_DN8268_c0_g3_i1.p1 TRINITY_DN8268_c0_g3~~TRINITY_DN8268_c0_g3_i1.p1  ORF type:complete len:618 (-),score=101.53 TRINITY_DN8268_c0_g3_i1:25-1878(-)